MEKIRVQRKQLSEFLDERVDFLKLDLEGVETEVLEEAKDKLENVRMLFCEYHHSGDAALAGLTKILNILDEADFDVHLSKASDSGRYTGRRSMKFVGRPYSVSIWAKNRRP